MDKVTVNDVPLQEHLKAVWTNEAGKTFQQDSRKYWKGKSKVKFIPSGRNGKVRQLEEWEIFVHQMDKDGKDIADLSVGQLSWAYRKWLKERKG